jgi:hypothetical protein
VQVDKHPAGLTEALHPGLLGGIRSKRLVQQPGLRSALRTGDIDPTPPLRGNDIIQGARRIEVSDAVGAVTMAITLDRFARRAPRWGWNILLVAIVCEKKAVSGAIRVNRVRRALIQKEAPMSGGIAGLMMQASAGGACANVAGELPRKCDLGTVGNTIAAIAGGGIGRQFRRRAGAAGLPVRRVTVGQTPGGRCRRPPKRAVRMSQS